MQNSKEIKLLFQKYSGGKLESSFLVHHGASSFDDFKQLPGNEEKTLQDFYLYIKGKNGSGITSIASSVVERVIEVKKD